MLTYYPVGPLEDQTYVVIRRVPDGVSAVIYEHLSEQDAIDEADRLNKGGAQ